MQVQELIERLQAEDPEAEVLFGYDYGDYIHTQVAASIEDVEEQDVQYSDQHNMKRVLDPDHEEAADLYETVVLIS